MRLPCDLGELICPLGYFWLNLGQISAYTNRILRANHKHKGLLSRHLLPKTLTRKLLH